MAPHMVKQSHVLATPAAPCAAAQAFFQSKLHYETDPADVYTDMQHGVADFVLLDVRSQKPMPRATPWALRICLRARLTRTPRRIWRKRHCLWCTAGDPVAMGPPRLPSS